MASRHTFAFGPFTLDADARRLTRNGAIVRLTPRQFDLLHLFVRRPGEVLPVDRLISDAWSDVATTTNNLVQVVRKVRERLDPDDEQRYIQTLPRDGYRFAEPVTLVQPRATDAELDALLAPHRAFMDGRAALDTLERASLAPARTAFEEAIARHGRVPAFHVALANACALQFETTRADARPDVDALGVAATHAREACRLDPQYGEGWATLGFVLERTGRRDEALAALRRSIMLQPNEWRHQFRLAFAGWGYERLAAAERTVALSRGCPQAHWLAATVFVARDACGEAERELDAGIAELQEASGAGARLPFVALYWLKGLLALARGDTDEALGWFDRELALESAGHVYARECCANTWYAIGAVRLQRGDRAGAIAAFDEATARVPAHARAEAGRALAAAGAAAKAAPILEVAAKVGAGSNAAVHVASDSKAAAKAAPNAVASAALGSNDIALAAAGPMDRAIARATVLVASNDLVRAAALVDEALAAAPLGNAGWTIPIEPLLAVGDRRDAWTSVLARLRHRAS
ncbi:MAG: winged helix-turn-helix domain-containing protein [Acidobacteria bacterium]|nr:winged helix-turn-helix domain-containing protein [Acidobacteriota bacterium]